MCEIDIISYYFNKNKKKNILKEINSKINKIFGNEYKIKKDINTRLIIQEIPRKYLLENLEYFEISEIEEYKNDIEEVFRIYQEFIEQNDELYNYYQFLKYLKDILFNLLNVIKNEKLFEIKINKMKVNKDFFTQYELKDNEANEYSRILFWFRNMINEDLIPKKIDVLNLEKLIICIFFRYYRNLYENNKIISIFKMLENKPLRTLLKKINLECPKNKENIKKLYDILLFYDDIIKVDEKKKKL